MAVMASRVATEAAVALEEPEVKAEMAAMPAKAGRGEMVL
jgi:hypothetical protein